MDVLKELLDNARKLLGQMSSTQRASIVAMVATVGALLVMIVWLGGMTEKKTKVPLEITVAAKDFETIRGLLLAEKIGEPEYDNEHQLILVNPEDKHKALMVLAKNNAIPANHGDTFEQALEKVKFTDTQPVTAERFRTALENEVAMMIETIDGVDKAKVIYNAAERKPLFRAPFRQRASVVVSMKLGKQLDQKMADTIINLVTFARSGLDEKDVVVTDQKGAHFRKDDENSIGRLAAKGLELSHVTSEKARREIEECVRRIIPASEVYAWVDTKWNMDQKNTHEEEILAGQPIQTNTKKIKDLATEKTANVVGTNPNVSRTTNIANNGAGREITRQYDRADKDVRMENGKKVTDLVTAPVINSQTVSVVVHLPPRPATDPKTGKPVYELGEDGKPLTDPYTKGPKVKMASMKELSGEELRALERSIRNVAGMPEGAQNMSVEISQVPWLADLDNTKPPEEENTLQKLLSENVASIFMMFVLLAAIFFVYRLAKRSIPAEEVDLPDGADFGGLFTPAHLTDEDRAQADFEQMRDQVGEFVDEDPAKAASIVRRWMVTREGY